MSNLMNKLIPQSAALRTLVVILAALVLGLGTWMLWHSEEGDPKNVRYLLWRAGLYDMDADSAAFVMLRDGNRDELVVGKTKEQLKKRFHTLLSINEVSQYYRDGSRRDGKDRDVLFIGHSPWMIVFDGDKATELILMKGY
jgi:hypothetical protein